MMANQAPFSDATRRVVAQNEQGKPEMFEMPIPQLRPDEVLIKPTAVALNPSDYKMGAAFPRPGAAIGNDIAGTIIEAGEDTGFVAGDVVWGAALGSKPGNPTYGAFSTHACAPSMLVRHLDPGISIVEASTMAIALGTSALAFWRPDTLNLLPITPDNPAKTSFKVLVYGGSTASGTIAIQLLRLCGLDPIATCSPPNFDLVRSYGASAVFDYADPATPAAIKTHTDGQLKHVLDCISDAQSVETCFAAIARVGGRYVSLEAVPDELLAKRRAVRPSFVFAYELVGDAIDLPGAYGRPADLSKREMGEWAFDMFARLINARKLRSHPVHLLEGGLDGVVSGLETLRSGSVRGKKLVLVV